MKRVPNKVKHCRFARTRFARPLLAALYADADCRGSGTVWYRNASDFTTLRRAAQTVRKGFPEMAVNFNPTEVFIATWDNVGYYEERSDKVSISLSSFHFPNLVVIV